MDNLILSILVGYVIGQVLFLIFMNPIIDLYWWVSDRLEDLYLKVRRGK